MRRSSPGGENCGVDIAIDSIWKREGRSRTHAVFNISTTWFIGMIFGTPSCGAASASSAVCS